MERLDKYIANSGVGTRSEVKKYLKSGRVCVNGEVIKNGDKKIDPENDCILFDSQKIEKETFEYLLLHKPSGCVTATSDSREKTVMDYVVSSRKSKLFPVGRLDKDTEGLLLITDDGELAHKLLSPKKHVPKTYYAKITGCIDAKNIELFEKGIDIGDEKNTLPASLEIVNIDSEKQISEVLLTIYEGRFHQVKRMFHTVGHEVFYLKRMSMGNLVLEETLLPGTVRKLTNKELKELFSSVGGNIHES